MKHYLWIAACMSIVLATAQTSPTAPLGRTSLGFRAGINFQNFNGKDQDGDMLDNNLVTRFHAGLNVEIPVAVDFFFQPGLIYSTKGSERKTTLNDQAYNTRITLGYIELPLNLVYKPLLGTGHLILGFGPYVAYGVNGKARYELGSTSRTEDVKFRNSVSLDTSSTNSNDMTYFRAWDAGANLMAGYEFRNRLSLQLNVQLGLVKINSEYANMTNDKTSIKNTGFGISLGYRL